ncbi:MAG: hypothetical protein FWD38_09185 [Oscillospiraceae bacterium]|nr:hypothetical protein [Oscillospiraceae bacterium]
MTKTFELSDTDINIIINTVLEEKYDLQNSIDMSENSGYISRDRIENTRTKIFHCEIILSKFGYYTRLNPQIVNQERIPNTVNMF